MLAPVVGCFVVNRSCSLVEDRLWIAVLAGWRIYCLPDVELLPGAAAIAKRSFEGDVVAHGDERVPEIVAHGRLLDVLIGALEVEHILPLVEIHGQERTEVHRIGARDESAIIVSGIKYLRRKRFPPAGGTSIKE